MWKSSPKNLTRTFGLRSFLSFLKRNETVSVLVFYIILYSFLFLPRIHGFGQFWDSTFPYFQNQISNFFFPESYSWISTVGTPLKYASDYFFRFAISCFAFFQPETLLYCIHVGLFSLGSLGVFLLVKNRVSVFISVLLSLSVFISPAIFCITNAGYINDVASLTIVIFFIYYLINVFKPTLKGYLILSLFMTFVGIAIQFFVMTFVILVIYFLIFNKKVRIQFLPLVVAVPVLINFPWLVNAITGAASITELSEHAAKSQNLVRSSSSLLKIFNLSFSTTTLIDRFYSQFVSNVFLLGPFLMVLSVVRNRINRTTLFYLLNLIFFIFLGIGSYRSIPLWPIDILYPMFREMQHIIPLITLFLFLPWSLSRGVVSYIGIAFLLVFVSLNGVAFLKFNNSLNFSQVRAQFSEFNNFTKNHPETLKEHTLAYPFFNQYGFVEFPVLKKGSYRLSNTGWDSYMKYSGLNHLGGVIPPHLMHDSLQYKFVRSYDLSLLAPYNVRYIFDFSKIYESFYNQYVPASTYDNDLSIIKNDPSFIQKVTQANPGSIKKVSENIYQVISSNEYISAIDNLLMLNSSTSIQSVHSLFPNQLKNDLYFVKNTGLKRDQIPYPVTQVFELFDDNRSSFSSTTLDVNEPEKLTTVNIKENQYNYSVNINRSNVEIRKKNLNTLQHNRNTIINNNSESVLLSTVPLNGVANSFVEVGGKSFFPFIGQRLELGYGVVPKSLNIYSLDHQNVIINPSFESGLWKNVVDDCNKIATESKLGMDWNLKEKSTGHASLQLRATTHTACTSQKISLVNKGESYAFSFDYQSPNATKAGFYIVFNDKNKTIIRDNFPVIGRSWNTYSRKIDVPLDASNLTLYVYGFSQDGVTEIVNRYDNFKLFKINDRKSIDLVNVGGSFYKIPIDLKEGQNSFEYYNYNFSLKNTIANPSFESGLWQDSVTDCRNYDSNPLIAMKLSEDDFSDGKKSLELSATRHSACTETSIGVKAGAAYVLSFDYQSPNFEAAAYYIGFNDAAKTRYQEEIIVVDSNWHSFSKVIKVPDDAGLLSLVVYARETDGEVNVVNRYDNFKLVEIPYLNSGFYVVSDSGSRLEKPKSVNFDVINPTRRKVHVKSTKTPFYLTMSENYNTHWMLMQNNIKVRGWFNSWSPFASPDSIPNNQHIKLNDSLNAWYVDTEELCVKQEKCTKNPDGSYDIEMTIEFWPQRWFYLGLLISGTTFAGCIGYLIFDSVRILRRKRTAKQTPV